MSTKRLIIDGRAIADDIYTQLKERRAALPQQLSLGVIAAGADAVIDSFIRIKSQAAAALGIAIERVDLPSGASTEDAIRAVQELAARTQGIIVQLPLPRHFDTEAILAAIPDGRDVDAINPAVAEHAVLAPVARAALEILERSAVAVAGKRAIVVGEGRLVGAPAADALARLGARVSTVSLERGSMEDLKSADIIVSGAGQPGLITPDLIKDGVALIDAGASEQGGAIRGDADPACAEKASVFTPVPRGVGPVAVAMIFKNLFDLIEKKI